VAWGWDLFFRRRGGELGDFFQLVFDIKQRLASLSLEETADNKSS
jgi:hypothetical protein